METWRILLLTVLKNELGPHTAVDIKQPKWKVRKHTQRVETGSMKFRNKSFVTDLIAFRIKKKQMICRSVES